MASTFLLSGGEHHSNATIGSRRDGVRRQPGQGAPSQHGRIQPQPSQRSWEVSQRIIVPQLGQGSVRSAMRHTMPRTGDNP
ncbi:hypothetical protein [Dermacoccus barathri]|uniref:Uncharacterized protein n=1 Tax=Dermacoccus barathri TaxID=322601 RepID=A0ABN2B110_9MICO